MAREFASIVYCQDTVQSKDIIHVYECRIRVFFLGEKKRETRKSRFSGWAGFSSYRPKISAFLNFPTVARPK
jgi:hypothetical protein